MRESMHGTWFSLKFDISVILRLVATFYKSNSSPQKYNFDYFLVGLVETGLPKTAEYKDKK
jgi:hypothetical protein